jgi:hypothetical protein
LRPGNSQLLVVAGRSVMSWRSRLAKGSGTGAGPGEEVLGLDEALLGVFTGAGRQGRGGGFGPHFRELVPEGELAQQPLVG